MAHTRKMKMSLRYLPLRCSNLDRAQDFYENVLGLTRTGLKADEFVQYDLGPAELCV